MNAAHLHLLVNHLPIVGFAIDLILLVATLINCGAMAWTGSTGGKIRHTEVRGTMVFSPSSDD